MIPKIPRESSPDPMSSINDVTYGPEDFKLTTIDATNDPQPNDHRFIKGSAEYMTKLIQSEDPELRQGGVQVQELVTPHRQQKYFIDSRMDFSDMIWHKNFDNLVLGGVRIEMGGNEETDFHQIIILGFRKRGGIKGKTSADLPEGVKPGRLFEYKGNRVLGFADDIMWMMDLDTSDPQKSWGHWQSPIPFGGDTRETLQVLAQDSNGDIYFLRHNGASNWIYKLGVNAGDPQWVKLTNAMPKRDRNIIFQPVNGGPGVLYFWGGSGNYNSQGANDGTEFEFLKL